MNKAFRILAKSAFYFTTILVSFIVLIRVIVGSLIGSHNDLALIASPFVLVAGVIAILWLSMKFYADIDNEIEKDE